MPLVMNMSSTLILLCTSPCFGRKLSTFLSFICRMTEPESTVTVASASCSETTKEEKLSLPFPETVIGIDIGTSPCSVSMWNGSQVELLKLTIDEMIKRSCETFKYDGSSIGVTSEVTLSNEHEATVFKRKRLIDMVDSDLVVHASTNFPFLMHNLDIKV
ncbi:heat shock 70 kDa protein 8-like, partial [Trifolium medium]|nr:heat shock 70 kDa protein 8-like [Trifolium medium]